MDLKPFYEMVESCIQDLGVDPDKTRGEKPGQWDLFRGSARVMIDVFTLDNGWSYFQCIAPIVKIPENKKTEFYEEILEKNHSLYGVGMTKFKDWIYIKVIREVEGIDKNEMTAMLKRVGVYADELDDFYKNKYGGEEV
ncbi:MAG: YbjN domain-containing protein [Bacteroidales bacterium]|nr:YbjN domain-containing protein [Bacteroidales bacterium]